MRGAPVLIQGSPALNSSLNSSFVTPPSGAEPYVHLSNDAKEITTTYSLPQVQPLAILMAKVFQTELKVNRGGQTLSAMPNQAVCVAEGDYSIEHSNVFSPPRPGRCSRYRSAAVANAMETAFKAVDTSHWEGGPPPVLATFAFRGKKGELRRIARNDEMVNKCWKRFLDYYEAGWGAPLEARWYKEFDENQFPHLHVQFVLPSGRARHKKGRGCRLGFLDGLEVEEWMEQAWCYASRQRPGRSTDGHGRHAWIPRVDEIPQYKSLSEHEKVFILYARKDCNEEWRAKAVYSHRTPLFWVATGNKQVTWYGVTPALSRRLRATTATITISCMEALRALKDYLHDLSGAERQLVDGHNEETGEIEQYDGSYWSNERRQLRGGVLRRPLSGKEYARALHVVRTLEESCGTSTSHDCQSYGSLQHDEEFAAETVMGCALPSEDSGKADWLPPTNNGPVE